jgi:hypothetical protein
MKDEVPMSEKCKLENPPTPERKAPKVEMPATIDVYQAKRFYLPGCGKAKQC